LNEPAIRKAQREAKEQGKRIELSDGGCKGLMLRLTPAGAATWVLYVRDQDGKPRKFPLEGSFPDMSVAAARAAAMALHGKVKTGFDPISQKRERRATVEDAKKGIGTLRALLDDYERKFASDPTSGRKFIKSWKAQRQAISHVFAAHLDKPVATMAAMELRQTAEDHAKVYMAALAVRCLRPVLKHFADLGKVPGGLSDIKPPATVRSRERTLLPGELRALLPVLRASERPYGAPMLFMLLTLARREEVCQARWREIDWGSGKWTIPARRAKNGEEHELPLSRQALAILRAQLPADDVCGKVVGPDPNALIFKTKTGAALGNWDRESKALLITAGLARVKEKEPAQGKARKGIGRGKGSDVVEMIDGSKIPTRHDLRRTGATLIGLTGVAPHIIEAALNHVAIHNRLAATYNRSRYRSEVADALQALADQLDTIESGGAKVIQIGSHRA
jgi:integrase